MSTIRMSGMISGLDTEAIVSAMVATRVAKKEKLQKSQTLLSWKQDAYKAINAKVYSLYSKIGNLRFSSAYSMKKTTVSDPTKATITASGEAINGTQTLEVRQLARSGYLTGAKLSEGTTSSTTLGQLGYTGEDTTITVRTADGAKDIKIGKNTTVDQLVTSLNNAGVRASFDAGNSRIFVSAKETGTANDFSLTASDLSGLKALAAAGLSVESEANNAAYARAASYAKGLTAIDGNGRIVSYFELDKDGNLVYDEDGNPKINEALKDLNLSDEQIRGATEQSIKEILENLKNAYNSNAELDLEQREIQEKINYSVAKDAINSFLEDNAGDPDKKAKAEQLVSLLSVDNKKYSYVEEDGSITENYEKYHAGTSVQDKITELAKDLGLITEETDEFGATSQDRSALDKLQANVTTADAIDKNAVLTDDDKQAYYIDEEGRKALSAEDGRLTQIAQERKANQAVINDPTNRYWDIGNYAGVDIDELASSITDKIMLGKRIATGEEEIPISAGATRVDAQDAQIVLNGADYTSSTNTFTVNGLTIKATAETTPGQTITISTDTDTQGLYDKIKDFLSEYNSLINELSSLYNADSASGYEPLTDEEKSEMSDSDIEKWEQKIKDSLLRRDSTIGGVMDAMTNAMMQAYTVNGKTYTLGSFGIQTLGYLNAAKNENYAYHIAGDSEDSVSAGSADKLMAALTQDPDAVIDFMKQLASGLYDSLDKKMKGTNLSSVYTIYNDKQMASEYSSYTKQIKDWEKKIQEMEDRYYKQYSNMEKQLAAMQNATSSLTSLFGNK